LLSSLSTALSISASHLTDDRIRAADLLDDQQTFAMSEILMRMNRYLSLLIAVTIICGPISPALSQDSKKQDEDVIKISAQLVQVDVIVTDKDNNPVSGFKREDFELYDNDKLQNISFFSYEHSQLRIIAEDADETRMLPRVVTPKELRRVVAFVVDTLHMSFDSIYRTRKMLRDFIDTQMEPGDLILILPTGGGSGLFQQFTADQRLLRRAVNHLRQVFILNTDGPARRGGTNSRILESLPALGEARPNVPQAPGQGGLGTGANVADAVEEADARATIAALNGTIQAMAKFPGRKIGVFISEGLRVSRSQAASYLTDATYRAARANVVFYSIDPVGLPTLGASAGGQAMTELQADPNSPTGFVSSTPGTPGTEVFRQSNDYFEAQEALNRLANETGGKFYRNSNDIKRGLVSLLKENSAYYLLGFQPEDNKWDGKFHKLKIVIKDRPDLTVTTRKGYLAKTEKSASREATNPKVAEIQEAFYSPLVRRDIDVQLTPYYRDDNKREPVLTTMLHIDTSRMSFKQVEGLYKNKVVMTGLLIALADGKVVDSFSNTLDLNYAAKDYEGIRKDGLLVTRAIGVKPGSYQLRVLIREAETGAIGTAHSFVDIPELKTDRLALSSIFTDAQLMQQNKAGDAISSASSLSQRRFPRGGQFAYVLMVYNAKSEGGKAQLEISSRLLRNGELIYKGQPKPIDMLEGSAPPSRIITGGILQLANLPPDDYTLEVTVTDKLKKKDGNMVRQEIDFSVE
jgi:VWFA-related protein